MQTGQQTHTHTNNCTGKISRFTKDLGYTKPNTCTENTNTQAYTHTQNLTAIHTQTHIHTKKTYIYTKKQTLIDAKAYGHSFTQKKTRIHKYTYIKHTNPFNQKYAQKTILHTKLNTLKNRNAHKKHTHAHSVWGIFIFCEFLLHSFMGRQFLKMH